MMGIPLSGGGVQGTSGPQLTGGTVRSCPRQTLTLATNGGFGIGGSKDHSSNHVTAVLTVSS